MKPAKQCGIKDRLLLHPDGIGCIAKNSNDSSIDADAALSTPESSPLQDAPYWHNDCPETTVIIGDVSMEEEATATAVVQAINPATLDRAVQRTIAVSYSKGYDTRRKQPWYSKLFSCTSGYESARF